MQPSWDTGGRRPAGKRLGQHFLVDRAAIRRIVGALELRADDAVLEIGPGRGALTEALIDVAGRIAAIELDRVLAASLRRRFSASLVLIESDILRVPLAAALEALGHARAERIVVVGNLPYNISKPLTQKLIAERENVSRAVLMFQREVAQRLTAGPGSPAYGPLGILAGSVFDVETLFDLPPRAFRPPPRVHSTVTRWNVREDPPSSAEERHLRACLQATFARRRRTLRNNLLVALGSAELVEELLRETELDGSCRAEQLAPEALRRLASRWSDGWRVPGR